MHECEYALVRSSKALEAALMIQAAAIPLIWVPSVISPFPLRLPQRPPRRFVSSSLTRTGISLLSLSDKSTVDVVGNLDVDYVTGPFCSLFFVRHFAV
jgi:hypothetical protein